MIVDATGPRDKVYAVQHPQLLTDAASSPTAWFNVASLPPAQQQDADRRLHAFNDETKMNADTDFNAQYQEVFSRVIKTPADMEDRVRDMQRVIDDFVKHAQVVAHRCHRRRYAYRCGAGGGPRPGAAEAAAPVRR